MRRRRNPFGPAAYAGGPVTRIYVGRKQGRFTRITPEHVASIVGAVLRDEGVAPAYTMFDARGVWAATEEPVEEPTSVVLILSDASETFAAVRARAERLAYTLAGTLQQEEVMVELTRADGSGREVLSASCVTGTRTRDPLCVRASKWAKLKNVA